jgi:hypothetical protein
LVLGVFLGVKESQNGAWPRLGKNKFFYLSLYKRFQAETIFSLSLEDKLPSLRSISSFFKQVIFDRRTQEGVSKFVPFRFSIRQSPILFSLLLVMGAKIISSSHSFQRGLKAKSRPKGGFLLTLYCPQGKANLEFQEFRVMVLELDQ